MLKCAACGFEEGPEYETFDVLFKSGKRKGQVSHHDTRRTGIPQWEQIVVEKGFDFVRRGDLPMYGERYDPPVNLFACPKCGTVRIEA